MKGYYSYIPKKNINIIIMEEGNFISSNQLKAGPLLAGVRYWLTFIILLRRLPVVVTWGEALL